MATPNIHSLADSPIVLLKWIQLLRLRTKNNITPVRAGDIGVCRTASRIPVSRLLGEEDDGTFHAAGAVFVGGVNQRLFISSGSPQSPGCTVPH